MTVVSLDLAVRPYQQPGQVRIMTSGNPCTVPRCDYLAGDGYVCPTCVEQWEAHLANIAALVEDLELAERKAVRFSTSVGGSRSVDAPEPANMAAGYYLRRLHGELVAQIRFICETGHIRVPDLKARPGLPVEVAMALWLLPQSGRLAKLEEGQGAGLVTDLDQMIRDCLAVIDAPARRKFVTGCSCGDAVFAPAEKATARCRCGAEYDVEETYLKQMDIARDSLITIAEAAAASGVKEQTIKNRVNANRIEAHGKPRRVRYGDVLALAEEINDKKGRRA